jgi:hypothetical protein
METWAETTRRQLAHIPILPLEELRKLPEPQPFDAGIYFLWDGDELAYVGKSTHIMERADRQHRIHRYASDLTYWDRHDRLPHDRLTALVLETGRVRSPLLRFKLQDYERAYIAHYEPKLNHLDVDAGT